MPEKIAANLNILEAKIINNLNNIKEETQRAKNNQNVAETPIIQKITSVE